MNRTWKDAACEVAWNKFEKNGSICIPCFFDKSSFCWGSHGEQELTIGGSKKDYFMTYRYFRSVGGGPYSKMAFYAAFMKWLDENEVKR